MTENKQFTYSCFRRCEYKGQAFRLCRHLPGIEKKREENATMKPIPDTEAGGARGDRKRASTRTCWA